MKEKKIKIEKKRIGDGEPVFVIAEVGVNHNGDIRLAKRLIDAAKTAGADAVKFQTFSPENLLLKNAAKPKYQIRNTNPSLSQYRMLEKLALSEKDHVELYRYAKKRNIIFLSTPYDNESIDLLERIGVAAYKLSSIEIVNHPIIEYAVKKGMPVILSTGLATMEEVASAVDVVADAGYLRNLVLLQCHFNYPTASEDVNLRVMTTLAQKFGVHVGFSDHTVDNIASIAAAALGARVIEKHLTLSKAMPGPDHRASLELNEFESMVKAIRDVEKILGSADKKPTNAELGNMVSRKSVATVKYISKGEAITKESLCAKRPGSGILPTYENLSKIIGKKTTCDIAKDSLIAWEMIR